MYINDLFFKYIKIGAFAAGAAGGAAGFKKGKILK